MHPRREVQSSGATGSEKLPVGVAKESIDGVRLPGQNAPNNRRYVYNRSISPDFQPLSINCGNTKMLNTRERMSANIVRTVCQRDVKTGGFSLLSNCAFKLGLNLSGHVF